MTLSTVKHAGGSVISRLQKVMISLIVLGVAGCVNIGSNTEPVQLFRLKPITQSINNPQPTPLRVSVSSGSLLNSQRLWVVQSGNRISGFEGARWAMPLPELWEQTLIRSLEHSEAAIVVESGSEYGSLSVALRDFQVESGDSKTTIKIALQATLEQPGQSTRHELFSAEADASLSDSVSLSVAFNSANEKALQDLVEWVADT